MVPLLYKVVLSSTFGRRSSHPFRSAIIRVSFIEASAVALGLMLGSNLGSIALPIGSLQTTATLVFAFQIITLVTLFSASGLILGQAPLRSQIILLPVSTRERLAVMLIPPAILTCMAITLVGIPLGVIALGSGIPLIALLAIGVTGGSAGMLTFFCIPSKHLRLGAVFLIPIMAAQYNLLPHISQDLPALLAVVLIVFAPCLIFIRRKNKIPFDCIHNTVNNPVKFPKAPREAWFIKKILRSSIMHHNLSTIVLLAAGFAALAIHNHLYRFACLPLATFLMATGISDLRALSKENSPPEITAMRGTIYFFGHHILGCIIYITAILPLLMCSQASLLLMCAHSLIAAGAGIFAGTIIVPASHDISGQTIATLICVGVLAIPPYLPFSTLQGCWGVAVIGLVLLATACYVELRRNSYAWRYYAQ